MKAPSLDYYRKLLTGTEDIIPRVFKFYPIKTHNSTGEKILNHFLIDAIMNHYLWHSNPDDLNDPFDCYRELVAYGQPSFETIAWQVQRSGIRTWDEAQNEIYRLWNEPQELIEAYRATTPVWNICSFTTNQTSNTMWSHYADCHTGLCLTFDNSKLADNNILACKVTYESVFRALDFFAQPEQALLSMVTTKSSEWSYENEFRSFHEIEGKHYYDKSCLVGITFGCKTTSDDIANVKAKVQKAGFNNIEWFQAKMQTNSFDLAIEPLNAVIDSRS
jgi:hypothetical protein